MPGQTEPNGAGASLAPALLAWGLAASCLVAAVAGLSVSLPDDGPVPWKSLLIPVVWSVPGAMIAAARPRALLGWLNLAVALLVAGSGLAQLWARGASTDQPLVSLAVWYADRGGAVIVPCMTLALMLLPDSRLPGPRWRWPVAAAVGVQLVLVALWSFSDTPAADPESRWSGHLDSMDNPLGVLPAAWADAVAPWGWALPLPLLLCVVAMVVRLRSSRGEERTRLVAPLLALAVLVAAIVAGRGLWAPVADVVDLLASSLLAVVLVAAVLRRHLEGVTVVVHHAFVFTVLGTVVLGAYLLAVGVLTAVGPDLSRFGAGVVAAAVAVAVHPLRARLQRWVDRLMHGDRRDPYQALTRLAAHAHPAPTLDEVLSAVADSVATSLRVPLVRVEAYGACALHPVGPQRPGSRRPVQVPLLAGEREVGSLLVEPQPGRRLRSDEERLLGELGRHAGLAIDSVRLAGEVAQHHRALVTAREEERRRLGRELHDDLGPTVAGLVMQLGALRPLVRSDPDAVVARLSRLEQAAAAALVDIRRVAHELRPPVLDQVGLGRAIVQVAESLDLVVVEETVAYGRLPAAVELAAYRIAAEALSNVARHSGVRSVRLQARQAGGSLVVVVADDGRGLDGPAAPVGLGCTTMRERAEELGGSLTVRSGSARGTVVTAVLPLEAGTGSRVLTEEGAR